MEIASFIPVGAWLWDKYGGSVTDRAAGTIKGEWNKFRWNAAAERYRAKIKKVYGTMQIMGMSEPVPLDDIFTDAYMLDKPTALGRFDIERLKQQSADPDAPTNAERINGLRLVVEKGNLFVLGKPGAGKTTFLKYIALKAAEQTIDKVPIFVSLKHWADSGLELMPFIAERFDICDFPAAGSFVEELLRSGNAIVLFDGLDEVNQESGQRDKQTRAINDFVEKYDRTQCLITCRIAANDYSFKPFTYVEIADFTEKQIEIFVRNWFRNDRGEKDEQTSTQFLVEFAKNDNKGLRDLARTPLLLTLLCLAFSETLTFPQRRAEIYQEALDALLKKWDSSRRIRRDEVYRKLSLGHKENMLARIAAETFEKNEYFIAQPELERYITNHVRNVPPHDTNEATDGEVILKAIEAQHGIFVERARGVYSFSHLTFQEYLTAKYLVANANKGTLRALVTEHCGDVRWREVFLLTASLLLDAQQFVRAFRNVVDKFLLGDEKLITLLRWADKKSASIQADSWKARLSYLCIELYYPSVNFELDKALDAEWNTNHSLDRANALDQALLLFLARARVLASSIGLTKQERLLSNLTDTHDNALKLAQGLRLDELAEQLTMLSLPNDNTTDEEAENFAGKVRLLLIEYRDIGLEWNLTERQEARLTQYLNATNLLRDSLELAFMPPDEKKAMQNSLYLVFAEETIEAQNLGKRH